MEKILTISLALLGAAIGVSNLFQVYILSDLRERVKRIEDRFFDNEWKGPERRHAVNP